MIESLSLTVQILIFIISGGIIWYFSNKLSHIVDFINEEYKLGAAFGGTILLSLIVNLPEVLIVIIVEPLLTPVIVPSLLTVATELS